MNFLMGHFGLQVPISQSCSQNPVHWIRYRRLTIEQGQASVLYRPYIACSEFLTRTSFWRPAIILYIASFDYFFSGYSFILFSKSIPIAAQSYSRYICLLILQIISPSAFFISFISVYFFTFYFFNYPGAKFSQPLLDSTGYKGGIIKFFVNIR